MVLFTFLAFLSTVTVFVPSNADATITAGQVNELVHLSDIVSCPCSFRLSVPSNTPPLDFVPITQSSVRDFNPKLTSHPRFDRKISLSAQSLSNFARTNGINNVFTVNVSHIGYFALMIRPSTIEPRSVNMTHISISITAVSQVLNKCPVLLASQPPLDTTRNKSFETATPRIVGGQAGNSDLADVVVAISRLGSIITCTGTLVTGRHVISAAHCRINNNSVVYVGRTGRGNATGTKVRVARVWNHPDYNRESPLQKYNDIAVVELDQNISNVGGTMAVNTLASAPTVGAAMRVAGFGILKHGASTESDDSNPRRLFNQVDLPVVEFDRCKKAYTEKDFPVFQNFSFCTGYLGQGGCDACQGDSGGPVFQYDASERPVLVGIVATGIGCAKQDFPGINVRVAVFTNWLKSLVPEIRFSSDVVQVDSGFRSPPESPAPDPTSEPQPELEPTPESSNSKPVPKPQNSPAVSPTREPVSKPVSPEITPLSTEAEATPEPPDPESTSVAPQIDSDRLPPGEKVDSQSSRSVIGIVAGSLAGVIALAIVIMIAIAVLSRTVANNQNQGPDVASTSASHA